MIKIQTVEIKETSKGDPYKRLGLENGQYVSMWSDDDDYELAVEGAELDRELVQNGKFTNLAPKGTKTVKTSNKDQMIADIFNEVSKISVKQNLLHEKIMLLAKHMGMQVDSLPDEDEDLNPEDIPF